MDRLQQAGVTSREAEVLSLLGRRLSNAEIAEQLFISVRTVESHVSALLAKLGAVDRRELGKLAAAPRPPPALVQFHTSFVGRSAEVGAIGDLLGTRRMITLVGPPGVGKTRLAVEVAKRIADASGMMTWFVDLAAVHGPPAPAAVGEAVLRAFGAASQTGQTLRDAVASIVGTSPGLVLIDNCEQVVEEAAEVVDQLLAAGGDVRILATSRESLALAAEVVYHVEPLAVPPLDETNAANAGVYPAVELFVDRATAASGEFAIGATNAASVVALCRRLDGLPLAIELAASRVRAFSTNELVVHLDQRFELLGRGSRIAEQRHRALRKAIDWSYELLDDDERALFERLSVFPASFDFDAARAVAAGPDAGELVRLLPTLVDKSLVAVVGVEAGRRYRLLETLRAYAAERLAARGADVATRARHLAWYLDLAERAAPELHGPRSSTWLARLDGEYDNISAALAWSLEHDARSGLRLAAQLWWFWHLRGKFAEGRRWVEQLLAASPDAPAPVRADAWRVEGVLAHAEGSHTAAADAFERSHALHLQTGNELGVAQALNGRGMIAWERGDYAAASRWWTRFLDSCRRRGDDRGRAVALNNLGLVAREQGRYREAETLLEECSALNRALGDDQGVSSALSNLAQVHGERDDHERASALQAEALELRRSVGDQHGIAVGLALQAAIAAVRGRYGVAEELLGRSHEVATEIGDRQRIAYAVCGEADVARLRGRGDAGVALGQEALAMFRKLGEPLGTATALVGLAAASAAIGEHEHATSCASEALELYRGMGHRKGIATAQHVLARATGPDASDHAAELDRTALHGFLALGCRLGVAWCLEGLAEHAAGRAQPRRSTALLGAASAIRQRIGAPLPPVDRPGIDGLIDALQSGLGERDFTARWHEGRTASLDEVVGVAMACTTR